MQIEQLKKQLHRHKKSFTLERLAMFDLAQKKQHFTAQELFENLKKERKTVSRMSVFRNVQLFEQIGLLRKVVTNSNALHYEINTKKNHHEHMQCLKCGKIIEFSDKTLHRQLEEIATQNNFIVQKHSIFLQGLCQSCSH